MGESMDEIERLKEENEQLRKQRDEYKNGYSKFIKVFRKQTKYFYEYQRLSEKSKEALSGIFRQDSFENFLACGVQPDNIDALWEFTKNEAMQNNIDDVNILNEIIGYFVRLYNDTNETPVLELQQVNEGDMFDIDMHIRTPESKTAGNIQQVILGGLTNAYTGAVIKKAVVIV